ncbi:MAG: SBBP repeat-containing protein [Bryobacteraceae bacterium]
MVLFGQVAVAATVPSLEWTKRFGGSQDDWANALVTDPVGNIYVAGTTASIDLPANGAFRQIGSSNLRRIGPAGAVEVLRSPLAGTVLAMTATRDALYVASSAGIAVTRSGNGTGWERIPTAAFPRAPISGIAVEPGSPTVIYVATGALWKSSDGGQVWAKLSGMGEFQGQPAPVYSVSVDPRRPGTVYAIGGGIASRSTDGGTSWTRLPERIASIAFDAERPEVVYAGGYEQLRISENGGRDWKPLPKPSPLDPSGVIADPSRPGTIYLRSGNTYHRSSDRGQTWKIFPIEVFNLIASADAPVLYAQTYSSGDYGLLRSSDAGETWTTVARNLFRSESARVIDFRGAIFLGASTPRSAFAAKFGPGGDLIWSTYLPGTEASALSLGPDRSVYVAASCMKSTSWEATPCENDYSSFVGKLSSDGQRLMYAREYAAGTEIASVAVDAAGSAYVAGTARGRIPTTPGSLWPDVGAIPPFFPNTYSGRVFAAKLSPDGSALIYSTYLGDWVQSSFTFPTAAAVGSILVEQSGHAIVVGGTIWKIGPNGDTLTYSTKIGTRSLCGVLDSSENLYVTGGGESSRLYASPGAYQTAASGPYMGFVTKLSGTGEFLESTLLPAGGAGRIALGSDDLLLLSGMPSGGTTKALIDSIAPGTVAGFDTKLSTLRFATPVNGSVLLLPDSSLAVVSTESGNSAQSSDMVFRAYRMVDAEVGIDAIVDAATGAPGPLVPRSLMIIRGAGLGQDPRVRVNDLELPVLRSSSTELWVRVPDEVEAFQSNGELIVESGGQRSQPVGVGFAAAAPALFTADGSGTGQALAFNEDGTLNSATNPAARGSILGLLVNGLGKYRMEGGSVVPRGALSVIFANTYANGVDANLVTAPGLPGPVIQVKIFVPSNYALISAGQTFPRAIPVWINVEGAGTTRNSPAVWVR